MMKFIGKSVSRNEKDTTAPRVASQLPLNQQPVVLRDSTINTHTVSTF